MTLKYSYNFYYLHISDKIYAVNRRQFEKIRDAGHDLQSSFFLFASGAQGHIISNANTLIKLPKTVFIEFTKYKKQGKKNWVTIILKTNCHSDFG